MGDIVVNALEDINKSLDVVEKIIAEEKTPDVTVIQVKIEYFCGILASISKEEAKLYSTDLEKIGTRVSEIYEKMKTQKENLSRKMSGLGNEAAAHAAYRKSTGL